MQFGVGVSTHITNWEIVRYLEELGYDRAWFGDSQMIWSDCYATLALAAQNTRRIKIGTGVSIAGTRIAPVTAHSIASINQIAPTTYSIASSAVAKMHGRRYRSQPKPICWRRSPQEPDGRPATATGVNPPCVAYPNKTLARDSKGNPAWNA